MAQARPDLVGLRRPGDFRGGQVALIRVSHAHRPLRRPMALNFTVGWGTWFSNRALNLRDRWFRLRTAGAYREAPRPL